MNCYEVRTRLLQYLENELAKSEIQELEIHLKNCWRCEKEFKQMEKDISLVRDGLSSVKLGESLVPKILANLPEHVSEVEESSELEGSKDVFFIDFVDPEKWLTLDEHIKRIDKQIERDLQELSSENKIIREKIREYLEDEFEIKTITREQLEWAEQELFSGNVCGVDGASSPYPMLAGIRARIGIAAISYKNRRTESVIYLSEQQVRTKDTDVLEIIRARKTENRFISHLLIGAIMLYMERKKALERDERWVFFNGPLIPHELRRGPGQLGALDPSLKLCEQLIAKKNVVGVVAKSTHPEWESLGLALYPLEYVKLGSLKKDLMEYLEDAHFAPHERKLMENFIEGHGDQIDFGIYKAGTRAYIFQTHKDCFDDAASLVMRDSLFQPIRAYPLLIDYADSVCKKVLPATDFKKMIDFKLAKVGELEIETPEIDLRRR